MGDIAELMLEGVLCQGCGEYLGAGNGYPESCPGCREEQEAEPAAPADPLYVGTLAPGHDIRRCRRQRNRRFYCTCSPGVVLTGVGVERHRIAVERASEGGEVQR